jgi:hypothetical protein
LLFLPVLLAFYLLGGFKLMVNLSCFLYPAYKSLQVRPARCHARHAAAPPQRSGSAETIRTESQLPAPGLLKGLFCCRRQQPKPRRVDAPAVMSPAVSTTLEIGL